MRVIVRCNCGGVTTYVDSSEKLLNLPQPDETIIGKDKILKLAEEYPGTPFAEHLKVISKKSGRYAFYIVTDHAKGEKEQAITGMYNLISGKKVY